jgi:hypothetical protein
MRTLTTLSLAALLGAAGLVFGFGAPVDAAPMPATPPQAQMTVADEQHALDDIAKARDDLDHGRRRAALNRAEDAETVLLNAQEAGIQRPQALKALETAEDALRHGSTKGVMQDLRGAEAALRAPGASARAGVPSHA